MSEQNKWVRNLKWTLFIILIGGGAIWFYTWLSGALPQIAQVWSEQPASNPIWFILITAVGTLLFLPISLFAVVAGAIYGPGWGTVWALCGILLGSTASFALSRYWHAPIHVLLERKKWDGVLKYKERLGSDSIGRVFLLRMVHLFPYNVLNIGYGLARSRWKNFLVGSFLAVLPWTFAYAFFGYTLVTPRGQNIVFMISFFAVLLYAGHELRQSAHLQRVRDLLKRIQMAQWLFYFFLTLIVIVAILAGSAALYIWRFPKVELPAQTPVDAVVVLGAGVGNRAAYERALGGLKELEAGQANLLVLSGGKKREGDISEARYMEIVLERQSYRNFPEIVLEERSNTTWENMFYTKELLPEAHSILIVSDAYHIPRAVLTARAAGFTEIYWKGIPGDYYTLDNLRWQYLREVPAVLWYLSRILL